jgi:peroxisome-assembly ATPase
MPTSVRCRIRHDFQVSRSFAYSHTSVDFALYSRHPTELYKNGIQRTSFLPAIDLLQQRFAVVDLDSGTDYRRIPRALQKVYFYPLTPDNRSELDKIFRAFTADDGEFITNRGLQIWGRTLLVPESSDNVARFSFDDLCGKPLSAADYLEVTRRFRAVFVTDVPKMGMGQKDLARRFITFIDGTSSWLSYLQRHR